MNENTPRGASDARQSAPAAVVATVPRVALSVAEACAALGVSWDFWREHVEPHVALVRLGRRKLVPVTALEAFLAQHAEPLVAPPGRRSARDSRSS